MRREKGTSPKSLFWLLVFVVGFGLVVWHFVWFCVLGCFFFSFFSFSSFDGNCSDFLTLQFIRRLGISWSFPRRDSGVIHTGSWHGCRALWLWGSALQLGQPGVEPDIPGSEDLPLWKPEGPAAHAEAMVHFQSRLSGRVTKHQARPSNPGAVEGKPLGICTGSYPIPNEPPSGLTTGGWTEETPWTGEVWEEKCRLLRWWWVSHDWTTTQTLLRMEQRGISECKLRVTLLYSLSLSFILISTLSLSCAASSSCPCVCTRVICNLPRQKDASRHITCGKWANTVGFKLQ